MSEMKYYLNHVACPSCGNDEIETTCIGFIYTGPAFRDENRATCQCGWRGVVHDLQPFNKSNEVKE